MQCFENENTVYFDVDDTLVLTNFGRFAYDDPRLIDVEMWNMKMCLMPHEEHIALLKKYSTEGRLIIVWSQRGGRWAEKIVKALKLEEFVDLAITKPFIYVDDLPAEAFMTQREFVPLAL